MFLLFQLRFLLNDTYHLDFLCGIQPHHHLYKLKKNNNEFTEFSVNDIFDEIL